MRRWQHEHHALGTNMGPKHKLATSSRSSAGGHGSPYPPATAEPSSKENGHSIGACGSTDWLEKGLPMSTLHAEKAQPVGSSLATTLHPSRTFSGTLPLP